MVSSRSVGTIWACDVCLSKTFYNQTVAAIHAQGTGHAVRPILEISAVRR